MYDSLTPLTPPGASTPSGAPIQPTAAPSEPPPTTYEPIAAPAATTSRSARSKRTVGPAFVVGVALASSLIASGGTYALVSATAHTQTTVPATSTAQAPAGQNASTGATAGSSQATVDIVKAVSPAVVTIVADGVTSTDPTTGQTGTGTATGSGLIFDANGLILTNHHVVEGDPQSLTVHLNDGRTFDASIYGVDTLTDLAIVKVDATGLPTVTIGDSAGVQVGQQAIAIGSPLGQFTDSVTSGIISALGRSIPWRTARPCRT
jgi:S1-C subfamily serine protease